MTVADFLALLDGVREGPRGWTARCPAHPDRTPSLSAAGEGDRILVHCFSGCTAQAIVEALGLTLSDLFADGSAPTRRRHGGEPAETPSTLWMAVRVGLRRDRLEDLAIEEKIAAGVFRLHQRAQGIRQAVTALGRDDDGVLDLLADAAADERMALVAEATLDELRAEYQAVAFAGRGR